ncbi:MAG: putative Molybdopterin oxidoreductase subunit protein [Myxococcales bacterium]|nr:putative Molybdopterin oxidoreductase subunit protein [Myxococcales bacterium]
MAALFPPSANAVFRAVVIAIVVAVTVVICAPMIYIRTPYASDAEDPVPQPIEFDHRHHFRDDGIDCVYCHETVETQASAGLPSTAKCMGCHSQIWLTSPEVEPLRASWTAQTPIAWRRVNAVPAFVYFHHGVHIQAGVQCVECHGHVENMPRVYRANNLTMNFCMDCHRKRQGSRAITRLTTCTTCHR